MSKPFDYSKWDNIELSDDEDDVHPNIDRESWFRMKHRSRVEREDNEAKDKALLRAEMDRANQRMQVLRHDLAKLSMQKKDDSDADSDDEDLDDAQGKQAELKQLEEQNKARQAKLDEYEKTKKWNVDNMFQVKEERTMVNPKGGAMSYTTTGYVQPSAEIAQEAKKQMEELKAEKAKKDAEKPATTAETKPVAAAKPKKAAAPKPATAAKPKPPVPDNAAVFESYPVFTEKYGDVLEYFMALATLEESRKYLLENAQILLQENASNYLLLASLEDEMNGHREKMKLTARQSQLLTNVAELAKTVNTHPGNVIQPFFTRLEQREHLEEFIKGVKTFQDKIIARAVVKKKEIDEARAAEAAQQPPTDLSDIPREERLGPGGLDPLEVVETLPQDMVKAFESRNVDDLKAALMKLKPEEAEHHMKRCIDAGLWVAQK